MNKQDALIRFKNILKDCKKDKNYSNYKLNCKIEKVSSSGMTRKLHFFIFDKDMNMYDLDYLISKITDYSLDKNGNLAVHGCGMDMIFNTLYNLNTNAIAIDNYKGKKKNSYNYIVTTGYNLI